MRKVLLFLSVFLLYGNNVVYGQNANDDWFIPLAVLRDYVEKFNAGDDELFATTIPNSRAYEFLSANIPRFECPDKQMEEIYRNGFIARPYR